VAFYTGSLEGTAYGGSGDGKLLYRLAEKRCANFGTCSTEHPTSGTSQVNTELFALFANGRDWLQQGRCSSVRPLVNQIVSLMTVPLVQGSLRYAYKNSGAAQGASAKNAAEGATFSAAVLPLVHYCNTASSAVVDANLKIVGMISFLVRIACIMHDMHDVSCIMYHGTTAPHHARSSRVYAAVWSWSFRSEGSEGKAFFNAFSLCYYKSFLIHCSCEPISKWIIIINYQESFIIKLV
jgi:hypothetical protein